MAGRSKWLQRRHGFARDERGATAVEFGLLAVPFFAIVGAILETSIVFLSAQVLESAVQDASRLIRTGQAQSAAFDETEFKATVCSRLFGLFDCDGLFVDVSVVSNFASATVTPPVDWNAEEEGAWTRDDRYVPGGSSNVVLVQAYYKWPVILSMGQVNMANLPNNKRLLATAFVFSNEPF